MDGVKSCTPGPHGPHECAAQDGTDECACGCDAFGRICQDQRQWWVDQQIAADQQAGRKSRWEDLP